MGLPVATQSSSSTHGGAPTSYSSNTYASSLKILRKGDSFSCPIHGARTVTGGSSTVLTNSLSTARVGDSISCGATLTNGITTVLIG
jgi:uncharacterized Zn-binding protein involved in type VI secretion